MWLGTLHPKEFVTGEGAGEDLKGLQRLPNWGEVRDQVLSRPVLPRDSDSFRSLGMGPGDLYIFNFFTFVVTQMILIHSKGHETLV